jgi:hypothetical protein
LRFLADLFEPTGTDLHACIQVRHVRLDVEQGRAIDDIDPVDVE